MINRINNKHPVPHLHPAYQYHILSLDQIGLASLDRQFLHIIYIFSVILAILEIHTQDAHLVKTSSALPVILTTLLTIMIIMITKEPVHMCIRNHATPHFSVLFPCLKSTSPTYLFFKVAGKWDLFTKQSNLSIIFI